MLSKFLENHRLFFYLKIQKYCFIIIAHMKKSALKVLTPFFAFSLLFGVGFFVGENNQKVLETSAYSTSSLPTTIDLNDTSASDVRSYYSSLNNLSTSERQGTNLLKNLKTILKNGQKYYSYDSGSAIWQMYEIIDRDWDKSPASSTTYGTYNSSTNKITGYTYGTSSSSSKNNPYIHALYVNRDVTNETTAWDDHQQTQWGINREHIWSKSHGFDSSGAGGARGDPMHLWAGNGYANNIHSNNFYGFVNLSSSYTDCGTKYSNLSSNYLGTSLNKGSGTVFEPQDCDKGDIARAVFYMVARYNYYSGSDSDGIDTNNPNLRLLDASTDSNGGSSYTSSTSTIGYHGIIRDLLAWNRLDPPDTWEIHRNNLLYTNYTNNRNPFIDFPEWAEYIWGSSTLASNNRNITSYSSTPTGYATPSSDTINDFGSGGSSTVVSVTGVSVTPTTVSIEEGYTTQLTATISPSNATNQGITWSSNSANATVNSNGVVTGVSAGTATITATTSDGGFTDTCTVTITESQGGGGGEDTPTTGDATIAAGTNGSSAKVIVDDVEKEAIKVGTSKLAGDMTITVPSTAKSVSFYGAAWNGKTAVLSISATNATVDKSSVTLIADTGIANNSPFTLAGNESDYLVTLNLSNVTGEVVITLATTDTSNGRFVVWGATYSTAVPTLTSISLDTSNVQTEFYVGGTFNYNNLVVTANYDDESSKTVTPSSVSSPDMSTAGNKTITVTYTEGEVSKTATYTISVTAKTITSISASVDKTYHPGEMISASDITVIDNSGDEVTTFTFDNDGYQFTYNDAASGGALTNKTFTNSISASGKTCSLTVQVQRIAREEVGINEDTLNKAFTGVAGTSYSSWSDKSVTTSSAVYAGNSAGSHESIQLRSDNNNSGIVTTTSGGRLSKVTVAWNSNTVSGRTLNIYGKNTAYSSPSDLYNSSSQGTLLGTIVNGTSTELTVSGSYAFVGIRSNSGAMYLTSVTFTYGSDDSATNVANYIMYEDTNGQCNSKFTVAKGYFEGLSKSERATFMSSDDYVISTARTRLEAWASYLGKSITYSDGDYVISNAKNVSFNSDGIVSNDSITLVVVLSSVLFITVGGYFLLKKRKVR